jgi:hypothetical protein
MADLFSSSLNVSIDLGFVTKRYRMKYFGTVIPVIKHQEIVKANAVNNVMISPYVERKSCLKKKIDKNQRLNEQITAIIIVRSEIFIFEIASNILSKLRLISICIWFYCCLYCRCELLKLRKFLSACTLLSRLMLLSAVNAPPITHNYLLHAIVS